MIQEYSGNLLVLLR